jgi:hypothetical protein
MNESRVPRSNFRRYLGAFLACGLLSVFPAGAQVDAPVRPSAAPTQAPQKSGFRAVSYEVFASLTPESQMLTARAIVELEAQAPSRIVECELHPNLTLSDVRDASGRTLAVDRGGQNGLDVAVTLPDTVAAGQRTKLTFSYSGVLATEENSPISGVRLASISKDGAYLLLPARWFPLTDYPANRFTGIFHIDVPQNFVVAGTGSAETPVPSSGMPSSSVPVLANRNPEGGNRPANAGSPRLARRNQDGFHRDDNSPTPTALAPAPIIPGSTSTSSGPRVTYTFRVDQPEAAGTFVAGALQLYPVQAEGLNI